MLLYYYKDKLFCNTGKKLSKIEKFIDNFSKYMAVIVLVIAAVSLAVPSSAIWIRISWINYLLMVVMFGMGLTLKPNDFKLIFTRPKDIIIGCIAQYTFMPLIALLLCLAFNLDSALAAGVILVGTCPGGTASNVITYFSKGDIALSVSMTSINTFLAPLLTPLITYMMLKTTVNVDIVAMFTSIIIVILVPVVLGCIINKLFYGFTQKIVKILPMISTIAICMIVAAVVSHNAEKIYTSGLIVLLVVILHNLSGYLLGFILGKILKMNPEKTKAVSIEIGMQNSGLAASLASTAFSQLPMATVPGAIFSVWHNISGAILAGIYRNWTSEKQDKPEK